MCQATDTVTYDGPEQQQELPGSDRSLPVFTYGYEPGEQKPVVTIIHDVNGTKPLYRDMGKRLASAGFAAILPDLFCREGPLTDTTREAVFARSSKHSFPVAVEDIRALVTHLTGEGRRVGLVGFCMGGTLGLFSASRIPALNASVVYYGFPVNTRPSPNRPDSPIDEVAQISAPLLGFFGEQDAGVGPDNVRAYEAAARQAGKSLEFTIYPDAGHSFLSFDPEAPTARPSQDSWGRTLAFFRAHLGA